MPPGSVRTSLLKACSDGIQRIGARFGRNEVFVPELLMAAKSMNAVMVHLKPFFQAGTVKKKGIFVHGTVADVTRVTTELVNSLQDKSCVIFSCSGDMPPAVSSEKIQTFIQAARAKN